MEHGDIRWCLNGRGFGHRSHWNKKIIIRFDLPILLPGVYVRGLLRNPTTPLQYPTRSSKRLHSRSWNVFHCFSAPNNSGRTITVSKCSRKNTVIQTCVNS